MKPLITLMALIYGIATAEACPKLEGLYVNSSGSVSIFQNQNREKTIYQITVSGDPVTFEVEGSSSQFTEKHKTADGGLYAVDETLTCTDSDFTDSIVEKVINENDVVVSLTKSSYRFSLDSNQNLRFVTRLTSTDGANVHKDEIYLRQAPSSMIGLSHLTDGFANGSITGLGQSYVQSAQNAGCDLLGSTLEQQATKLAQQGADANAGKKCEGRTAIRTTDYSLTSTIKYRGAGCLFTATAQYACVE